MTDTPTNPVEIEGSAARIAMKQADVAHFGAQPASPDQVEAIIRTLMAKVTDTRKAYNGGGSSEDAVAGITAACAAATAALTSLSPGFDAQVKQAGYEDVDGFAHAVAAATVAILVHHEDNGDDAETKDRIDHVVEDATVALLGA